MMQCEMDISALMRYHDGELAPDERERVAAHVAGCDRCRRTMDGFRQMSQAVADSIPATVDRVSVEEAVSAIRARWRRRSWTDDALPVARRLVPVAAAAAAVLAVVVLFGIVRGDSSNGAGWDPEVGTSGLGFLSATEEMAYAVGVALPDTASQE